jgi:hypothetical protein
MISLLNDELKTNVSNISCLRDKCYVNVELKTNVSDISCLRDKFYVNVELRTNVSDIWGKPYIHT